LNPLKLPDLGKRLKDTSANIRRYIFLSFGRDIGDIVHLAHQGGEYALLHATADDAVMPQYVITSSVWH
jgi:hypothetical protein